MIKLALIFSLFLSGFSANSIESNTFQNQVLITTEDGISIYADLYKKDLDNPIIILFHQGGSNAKAEYASIIPRLIEKGYNVLSVDQRVGGQTYGGYNRTVAKISNNNYGYCDAYPDLEASLKYVLAERFKGGIILWGSSYSASLAIQLGAKNSNLISGILAFSPASGGPMEACKPDPYMSELKLPLLLLRPASELERESSQNQFALAKKYGHQTYKAENGVHGSSMLV